MVLKLLNISLLWVLIVACSSTAVEGTPINPKQENNKEPQIYRLFEQMGGRLERLTPFSDEPRPYSVDDDVFVKIVNNSEKDICLFDINTIALLNNPLPRWQPAFALNSEGNIITSDTLDEFYSIKAIMENAMPLKSGKSQTVQLVIKDNFLLIPKGQYTIYFHAFAPFCDDLSQGKGSIPQTTHQVPIYETNNDFLEDYKKVSQDEEITIFNTPGVLYVLKFPVYINNDEFE